MVSHGLLDCIMTYHDSIGILLADCFTEDWTIGGFGLKAPARCNFSICLPTSPNSPNSSDFRVKHPMHHMLELD